MSRGTRVTTANRLPDDIRFPDGSKDAMSAEEDNASTVVVGHRRPVEEEAEHSGGRD